VFGSIFFRLTRLHAVAFAPTMTSALPLLVVVLLGVGFLSYFAKRRTRADARPWPFYARRLMGNAEQVLYHRLVQALPDRIILAQVALPRLLGVKKGSGYRAWYNRIAQMSVDFVVCGKDGAALAVIEVDDSTHERTDRQAADARKNRALEAAGIRLVRVQAKALPDAAAIKALLGGANAR